ncbi:MAG: anhydro-N-acetylmuramic acid kinase [Methylobacterium mesophilicum]|nr:anhydro-N-acetylmuramic acid kinase [Methylobacterium mesophilicum]
MSGTSMDGIDGALVETDGENAIARGPSFFVPYDDAFRARLSAALETAKRIKTRKERPGELAELEREITLRHADAVLRFLQDAPARWRDVAVVGFHGQTVLHRPAEGVTVQLGDGALLSERIGLPVVWDMRAADMEAGGQGAPLVPAYHAALAHSLFQNRLPAAIVNIGGISNISFVPAKGEPVAFDTGPGNALIDQWVARRGLAYDADGAVAAKGKVVEAVRRAYLAKPFFSQPGPKSLDRLDFTISEAEGLSLEDGARTLAAVSAGAILRAAEHLPEAPKLWVICGGGRKNPHIMGDLRAGASAPVILAEEAGLDGDATEAEAWAYLAVRSLHGLPLTYPGTTGCRMPVTGGVHLGPKGKSRAA